jgi:hypothetical protein
MQVAAGLVRDAGFDPVEVGKLADARRFQRGAPGFQRSFSMSYASLPDAIMNEYQATTLRKLSIEAYQPKLFADNLTSKEAAKRIEDQTRWPIHSDAPPRRYSETPNPPDGWVRFRACGLEQAL